MNAKTANELLLKIKKTAENHAKDPLTRLDDVFDAIEAARCFCGGDWKRGGRRQGSALCQRCYDEN